MLILEQLTLLSWKGCKTLDLAKGDIRFFREPSAKPYTQIVSISSVFKGVENSDFGTTDGTKCYFDIELNCDFGLLGKQTQTAQRKE